MCLVIVRLKRNNERKRRVIKIEDLAREIIRGLWKTTANVMAIIEGTVGGVASRDEHMSMLNEYKNCVGYLRLLVGLYILRRRRGNIL